MDLYVIQSKVTGSVKIGRSKDPAGRLRALQTGSPYALRLLAAFPKKGHLEASIHQALFRHRLRQEAGEWFHPDCLPDLPLWMYEALPFEDRWWR